MEGIKLLRFEDLTSRPSEFGLVDAAHYSGQRSPTRYSRPPLESSSMPFDLNMSARWRSYSKLCRVCQVVAASGI